MWELDYKVNMTLTVTQKCKSTKRNKIFLVINHLHTMYWISITHNHMLWFITLWHVWVIPYNHASYTHISPKSILTLSCRWIPPAAQLPIAYYYYCAILMYTIHHGQSLVYFSKQVNTAAAQRLRSGLRSASTTNYVIPRLLTKFGERAFSHAGLTAWNSLLHSLRAAATLNSFKRQLKTHLFNTGFSR